MSESENPYEAPEPVGDASQSREREAIQIGVWPSKKMLALDFVLLLVVLFALLLDPPFGGVGDGSLFIGALLLTVSIRVLAEFF